MSNRTDFSYLVLLRDHTYGIVGLEFPFPFPVFFNFLWIFREQKIFQPFLASFLNIFLFHLGGCSRVWISELFRVLFFLLWLLRQEFEAVLLSTRRFDDKLFLFLWLSTLRHWFLSDNLGFHSFSVKKSRAGLTDLGELIPALDFIFAFGP